MLPSGSFRLRLPAAGYAYPRWTTSSASSRAASSTSHSSSLKTSLLYLSWCRLRTYLQSFRYSVRDSRPCVCASLDGPASPATGPLTMAEQRLSTTLKKIHQTLLSRDHRQAQTLLTEAKLALLPLGGLIPSPATPQPTLLLARETLELGALLSIRRRDYEAFTRYFEQLQPFYDLPAERLSREHSSQSKVTGLHLLLLLSQGDYAGFHTVLESLEVAAAAAAPASDGKKAAKGGKAVEDDVYIQYPVRLEQDLMEGAYDKVWGATKSERVPSEEYGVFSEARPASVLIGTIRSEIATCSEKAYPSLPIGNAKNLLFLDSEGAVVEFARSRAWLVRDGRIYFPDAAGPAGGDEKIALVASGTVIENTIGYARELETIV
ncbi:MAG: regulatory particle non-ATPase [Thelocarpon impressellum]|nr:MAG: regulatory particle non-ATPase [Thelocarpon impressellum]